MPTPLPTTGRVIVGPSPVENGEDHVLEVSAREPTRLRSSPEGRSLPGLKATALPGLSPGWCTAGRGTGPACEPREPSAQPPSTGPISQPLGSTGSLDGAEVGVDGPGAERC